MEYYVTLKGGGVSHANEFIETSLFTRQIRAIATDDELKDLQSELTELPDKSDLIPGIGGDRRNHLLGYGSPKSVKESLTEAEKRC